MVLKPQDIVIVLKLLGHRRRPPFAQFAADLLISSSEVHAAMKRLQLSRLIHGPEMHNRPNLQNLEEFLIHGVKYAFPAKRGESTRGIATSYAAEPLKRMIVPDNQPIPVWPYSAGKERGVAFSPLYRTVPAAAIRDTSLYKKLALVDAIRDGRVRERSLAEQELLKLLRQDVDG